MINRIKQDDLLLFILFILFILSKEFLDLRPDYFGIASKYRVIRGNLDFFIQNSTFRIPLPTVHRPTAQLFAPPSFSRLSRIS